MAHRKWKETKQQSGTAGPGNMLGCCLINFHFLWAIHPIHDVQYSAKRRTMKHVKLQSECLLDWDTWIISSWVQINTLHTQPPGSLVHEIRFLNHQLVSDLWVRNHIFYFHHERCVKQIFEFGTLPNKQIQMPVQTSPFIKPCTNI